MGGIKKLVRGVGTNDATYKVKRKELVDGKMKDVWICPYWQKWSSMLARCYSEIRLREHPSYKGCYVCEEWLTFSIFKAWMEKQDWEGKSLDKDLLIEGNKVYSPDTCVFVEASLNKFMTIRHLHRGSKPLGVTNDRGSSRASLIKRGKDIYLGNFKSDAEAHKAYQIAKRDYALELLCDHEDERVKEGLQRIIDKLTYHIQNNIETKDL